MLCAFKPLTDNPMPLFTRPSATFVPAVFLVVISACGMRADGGDGIDRPETSMDSLVSVEWLAEHIDDPDLVVLDCTVLTVPDDGGNLTSVSGLADYADGHIPGAGFADLMGALSDADSPLRFAVPEPEAFAAAMEALGVGDDRRVVLYDTTGSMWAARVWWMLRWIGFDNAALLDGGLGAWTAAGHELSTDPASEPAGSLSVRLRPELIADRDEVLAAIGDDSVELIDALPEASFSGEMALYRRPGHITGASNVPVFSVLDDAGRFRSKVELADIFAGREEQRNIHYCGGGIAASATAFAMTRAGYDDVAVYTASLQEWAADPSNPMETGSDEAPAE